MSVRFRVLPTVPPLPLLVLPSVGGTVLRQLLLRKLRPSKTNRPQIVTTTNLVRTTIFSRRSAPCSWKKLKFHYFHGAEASSVASKSAAKAPKRALVQQSSHWSQQEKDAFVAAFRVHGKDWKAVSLAVGTRNVAQVLFVLPLL